MALKPAISDLSPSQKLQLVEDLWDDLAESGDHVPLHDWQKAELARRKENLQNTAAPLISWDAVKEDIRSRRA